MDAHTFQENWSTLCRKFPLVCALDLTNSTPEDTKSAIKSHCVQFDHVVALVDDSLLQETIKEISESERIINLTCFKSKEVPGDTFQDKIRSVSRTQMILVISNLIFLEKNVRWLIYDRVKEMKSPLIDTIKLDSNCQYCLTDYSFLVNLRLS
jgi:hypothetical protein